MSFIIEIQEVGPGEKCTRMINQTELDPCQEDAICAIIYDSGKIEPVCKKHLRRQLNKEIE